MISIEMQKQSQESLDIEEQSFLASNDDIEEQSLLATQEEQEEPQTFRGRVLERKFILIVAIFTLTSITAVILLYKELSINTQPLLVLISLDGARPEYFQRNITPNISKFISKGVYSEMQPVFPSITFPNHYTLVTGHYPATHGIVANHFYDPILNDTFLYVDSNKNKESKWWKSEPIWTTYIKQGYRAATCFWPGSEAKHNGVLPTYYKPFNNTTPIQEKIQWVKEWIELDQNLKPGLITLYIPDIDHAGHQFGPNSEKLESVIKNVDSQLGILYKTIQNSHSNFNMIIVSDHGMAESSNVVYYLDDYNPLDSIDIIQNGPLTFIDPKDFLDLEIVYQNFKIKAKGEFDVWKHEEVPEEYHYLLYGGNGGLPVVNTSRIGRIVLLARNGAHFMTRSSVFRVEGDHGYYPTMKDMHSIFIGLGPDFQEGKTLDVFKNLEVYNLLGHLLGIRVKDNNGTASFFNDFRLNYLK
jgi:predicted AlkP superfamily pyrophosphatase or phosphodiesterase